LETAIAGLVLTSSPPAAHATLCLAVGKVASFAQSARSASNVVVRHASASNVSQNHYTQLLTGALISYMVWHDNQDLFMLADVSPIIGSGPLIAVGA
jgi:hypothetical protein